MMLRTLTYEVNLPERFAVCCAAGIPTWNGDMINPLTAAYLERLFVTIIY